MNTRYDEFLYKNLRNILVSEFSCTVPFFPDYVTNQENHEIEICNSAEKRKAAYAKYDLLKRNKENMVCANPCSSIQTYCGPIFEDPSYVKNRAYLKIYLQSTTKINFTVLDYDEISLVADIGGYCGLLLGVSVIHLSKLVFKSVIKVVNAPRKKPMKA